MFAETRAALRPTITLLLLVIEAAAHWVVLMAPFVPVVWARLYLHNMGSSTASEWWAMFALTFVFLILQACLWYSFKSTKIGSTIGRTVAWTYVVLALGVSAMLLVTSLRYPCE